MLPVLNVPNVGMVALAIDKVALAETLIVPVTAKFEGIVNVQALVPSPSCISDPVPETVHPANSVTELAFLILNVWAAVTKSVGEAPPEPLVLVFQLATLVISPVPL